MLWIVTGIVTRAAKNKFNKYECSTRVYVAYVKTQIMSWHLIGVCQKCLCLFLSQKDHRDCCVRCTKFRQMHKHCIALTEKEKNKHNGFIALT